MKKKKDSFHDPKNPFCPINQIYDGEPGKACLCGATSVEPECMKEGQ